MAWPTMVTGDVLSGKGAETIGQNLFDRDLILTERRTSWVSPTEYSMTVTLADVGETKVVRLPPFCISGANIKLMFKAKVDSGSGASATFRLRETGGPTNGTSLVTALTASYIPYEVVLPVPDGTWVNVVKTLALQAQRPNGGEIDADWNLTLRACFLNLSFEAP